MKTESLNVNPKSANSKAVIFTVIPVLATVIAIFAIVFLFSSCNNDSKSANNSAVQTQGTAQGNGKYGVTKTITKGKYSVDIKFPKEEYDYSSEKEDTAAFSGKGLIRLAEYSNKNSEISAMQFDLDSTKNSGDYTVFTTEVTKATINNKEVNYILYKDNDDYTFIRADIYIKPDVKYYIYYNTDKGEASDQTAAYNKLVEIVGSIGEIKG